MAHQENYAGLVYKIEDNLSKNEDKKYYVPGTHFVKIETHNDFLLEKLNNVPYGYELASSSYVITSVSSSGHAHGIYVLFFVNTLPVIAKNNEEFGEIQIEELDIENLPGLNMFENLSLEDMKKLKKHLDQVIYIEEDKQRRRQK